MPPPAQGKALTLGARCPKCGSGDVRPLSSIYQETIAPRGTSVGATSATPRLEGRTPTAPHLSRQAAPPSRKHDALWSVAAVGAAVIAAGTIEKPDVRTAVAAAIVVLAVHFTMRSRRFNHDVFPRLHAQWERSVVCGRCGKVYETETPQPRVAES